LRTQTRYDFFGPGGVLEFGMRYKDTTARAWLARRLIAACAPVFALCVTTQSILAQDASNEQERLHAQMVREPTNYQVTFAYVKVATDRGDYEAAIAALERLLYYNPNLAHVKYELGTLYFKLRSFDMAKRYFKEALATPGLAPVTRSRIESYLPDTERQTQQSRFAGFAQTGVRYQSNANFAPSNGLVSASGQQLGLPATNTKRSDSNWFGLVGLSHDYDLNDTLGSSFETRFTGYLTQQFVLDDLNVGLVDGSFGWRIPFTSNWFPGASVKPYVTGGNIWVGGSQYLASGGAGVVFALPVNARLSFEPAFEWRHVDVSINTPVVNPAVSAARLNEFSSGDWYTGGMSVKYLIFETVKLSARGYYRRGEGEVDFQNFDQWVGEAALSFLVPPPFRWMPRYWTLSPFGRYVETEFDAANPSIDPNTTRINKTWTAGVILDTPITSWLGVKTTFQYDRTTSTLPNFRMENYSVLSGPAARF
jgi:hypothetical protein